MNLPYVIAMNAVGHVLVPRNLAYFVGEDAFCVMFMTPTGGPQPTTSVRSVKQGIDFMDMIGGPVEACLLPLPIPSSCTFGGPIVGLIILATALGASRDAYQARGDRDLAVEWFRNRLVRWSELIDWKVAAAS